MCTVAEFSRQAALCFTSAHDTSPGEVSSPSQAPAAPRQGERHMQRIGIIADNHSRTADGSDVPQAVLDAFKDVDLIVHCGDAGSWGGLDRLAAVAPVAGVRGGHNGDGDDVRITGLVRVLEIEGLRVGVVHDFVQRGVLHEAHPAMKQATADTKAAIETLFGGPVDVVLYAGTHVPRIGTFGGMLMVNPGSPTLPADRPKGSLGTVAILEVDKGFASARIVELWR